MNCINCDGILTGRQKKYCSSTCSKKRGRETHLLTRYGLTAGQWDVIYEYQKGLCGVCGKPEKNGKRFVVDHSHQHNYVRGLVHSYCNLRIISRHSDDMLIRVGLYAASPPAVAALGDRILTPKQKKRQPRKRK